MPFRSRRSARSSASSRRKLSWEGVLGGGVDQITTGEVTLGWMRPPAGVANTSLNPQAYVPTDWTLTRSRIIVGWSSSNEGAQIVEPWLFTFGLIVWEGISDDPNEIPNPPDPTIDLDADWIWRYVATPQVHNSAGSSNQYHPDGYQSKAQRKLGAKEGLLLAFAFTPTPASNSPGTLTIGVSFDARFLMRQN